MVCDVENYVEIKACLCNIHSICQIVQVITGKEFIFLFSPLFLIPVS